MNAEPIVSERLRLVTLSHDCLVAMGEGPRSYGDLAWPADWPDDEDRPHVHWWIKRSADLPADSPWRVRAIVTADDPTRMIGHAGFHLPPQPIDVALADATLDDPLEPSPGGAVEIGYTVFEPWRRQGFAAEAARTLIDWAFTTEGVGTVIATVAEDNATSFGVLERVGGFRPIGTCRDEGGPTETVLRRDRDA